MINDILVSLKEYLACMMPTGINVVLDSVKKDKEAGEGDVVITLLRIEEETSRKPQNIYYRVEKGVDYPTSPDIDLNLEVLISSPSPKYETALLLISEVISVMNSIKTVGKPDEMSELSFQRVKSMSISLMGLSFDQSLSMWQTLGGTLVPFAAYKIRMLTMPGIPDTSIVDLVRHVHVEPGGMKRKGKKPESLPKYLDNPKKQQKLEKQERKQEEIKESKANVEKQQKKRQEKKDSKAKKKGTQSGS